MRPRIIKETVLPTLSLTHTFAAMPSNVSFNLIERDYFFVVNNSNGNFKQSIETFGPKFSAQELSIMEGRLVATTVIALAFCAVMCLSAAVMVPLYGKI